MTDRSKPMDVRAQIDLSVLPEEKHFKAMRSAANLLTDDRDSVRVSIALDTPMAVLAAFTIPRAREMDVVDTIMRECAMFMEDLQDQTVWFPKKPRGRKTRRAQHAEQPGVPPPVSVGAGRMDGGMEKRRCNRWKTVGIIAAWEGTFAILGALFFNDSCPTWVNAMGGMLWGLFIGFFVATGIDTSNAVDQTPRPRTGYVCPKCKHDVSDFQRGTMGRCPGCGALVSMPFHRED